MTDTFDASIQLWHPQRPVPQTAQHRIAELEGENERLRRFAEERVCSLHLQQREGDEPISCDNNECAEARAALAPEALAAKEKM